MPSKTTVSPANRPLSPGMWGGMKLRSLFPVLLGFALIALVVGSAAYAQAPPAGAPLEATASVFGLHGPSERLIQQSGKSCAECHNGVQYPAVAFFQAESNTKYKVLWILTTLSLLIFTVGLVSRIRVWTRGSAKSLHKPIRWPKVWQALTTSVIFQTKILRMNFWRWFIFFSISMGFVALFLVSVVAGSARDVIHSTFLVEDAGANLLDFSMDFLGLVILVGVVAALVRRYIVKPEGLVSRAEDLWVLVMLLLIVATGFLLEALRLAAYPWNPEMRFSFVGNALADLIRQQPDQWLAAHYYLWMIHAALALIFIAAIPFTKIMHFMAAPLTILSTASEQPMHEFQPRPQGAMAMPVDRIKEEVPGG